MASGHSCISQRVVETYCTPLNLHCRAPLNLNNADDTIGAWVIGTNESELKWSSLVHDSSILPHRIDRASPCQRYSSDIGGGKDSRNGGQAEQPNILDNRKCEHYEVI